MNIALHAVTPQCPRCRRPVRSSVELKAELVDLRREARLLVVRAAQQGIRSFEEAREFDWAQAAIRLRLEALEAELQGQHLGCGARLH